MPKAFHITQWNPLYEKAETRKTDYMSWYPKQTKMVGLGIGKTMAQPYPKNMILRGLWGEIETLASLSRVQERGWLIRNGAALTAEMMNALMPTVPASGFQEALNWFSHPSIGWLEEINCPFISQPAASEQERTGRISQPAASEQERTGRISATEREREREEERQTKKREKHTPSLEEITAAATEDGYPVTFGQLKLEQALERDDFKKPAWRKNWRLKFRRFWKEDGEEWLKKNPAPRANSGGASLEEMRRAKA